MISLKIMTNKYHKLNNNVELHFKSKIIYIFICIYKIRCHGVFKSCFVRELLPDEGPSPNAPARLRSL